MERRLWTCVHELMGLQTIAESKYALSYSNWNDFGWQTAFGLYVALPEFRDGVCNVPIGGLSIVEHFPITKGRRFLPREGATNFTSFIVSVESAECMYLTLTYDERMELIRKLRIRFDDSGISEQGNYKMSTLRNKSREEFLLMQKKIKDIVMKEDDVSALVYKHFDKSKIILYP